MRSLALLHVSWKALLRRWVACLLTVAAALVSVGGAILLSRLTVRQEESLQAMIEQTKILCVVTDQRGGNSANLGVASAYVDVLIHGRHEQGSDLDQYVTDVSARALCACDIPSGTMLSRITAFSADPALTAAEGGSVQLEAGWTEDVLRTNALVCLIPESMKKNLTPDENGVYTVRVQEHDGVSGDLTVIGTVSGHVGDTIYCPFFTLLYTEEYSRSVPVANCSFAVKDNTKLEETREKIYETYFVVPEETQRVDPFAPPGVVIQDALYLETLARLRANLNLLLHLQPVLLILSACIGFFVSYLTTRRRISEFAVMRSLGMRARRLVGLVMLEQTFLVLLGGILGLGAGWLLGSGMDRRAALSAAALAALYLLGACAAVLQLQRLQLMKLLRAEE